MPDLDDVLELVRAERARQTTLLARDGRPDVLASPAWPASAKLAILVRIVGVLARAVDAARYDAREDGEIARELVQVAAVAVAWRESQT